MKKESILRPVGKVQITKEQKQVIHARCVQGIPCGTRREDYEATENVHPVMDNGNVVGVGTHDALFEDNKVYREMYEIETLRCEIVN